MKKIIHITWMVASAGGPDYYDTCCGIPLDSKQPLPDNVTYNFQDGDDFTPPEATCKKCIKNLNRRHDLVFRWARGDDSLKKHEIEAAKKWEQSLGL